MRVHMRITAGMAVAALAVTTLGGSAAVAVDQPERQATASIPNAKGAVTNWHLAKGSVYGDNLGPGMVSWFTTVYNGSVHLSGLDADLKNQLNNGKGVGDHSFGPTVIAKIGGPFAANKTEVGTVELDAAGTYLVNTTAKFDRKNADEAGYEAPTTETYPSLVLRYGDDGKDAGTIMGSPVSKAGYVELTSATTKTVKVTGPTTLNIYGFGYNEDRSAFGGGQVSVSGDVSVVKIG